ncbi:cytochrome P450 9e2-like [Trichogramma pretiosum]|uniref:cytochrome P450 9e2-like n=1 Tax=Trichogramma pretiosum TaxID=7493 RepID=UPI0006C98B9F|nr:cytochrome P450 9e2-like [Trichogramma pretiosum]
MELTFCVLVLIIAILLLYRLIRKRHNFNDSGIPQPPETLIIGSTGLNIIKRLHLSDIVKKWYNYDKDAKYIGLHLLMQPVIMLRDVDLVKTILIRDFAHFTDHKSIMSESLDPLLAKNLAMLNGDRWREVRNILSPSFTSKKMRAMFELMSSCAENFVDSFLSRHANNTEEVDTKEAFTKYTNDVIARCAFGIEIDSIKDPDNEFYRNGLEFVKNSQSRVRHIVLAMKAVIIMKFPRMADLFKMKLISEKYSNFFIQVIQQAIDLRSKGNVNPPDMLQLMMNAQDKTDDKPKLDALDITAQAFVFFLGGFETVSSHMCLMAHEIAINPDVQDKIMREIETTLNKNSEKVTYDAIVQMPYLDAVFQETLRLHPQATMLGRVCTKPYTLPPALPGAKPYDLEVGQEIVVPVSGIHSDPDLFDHPDQFDPNRYFLKASQNAHAIDLGFGLGPRMCIGNRFAILETKVLFFHLLRRCHLIPCSKTSIPLKYSVDTIQPIPKDGFWLRVKPKL